jgi:hypothetical protein
MPNGKNKHSSKPDTSATLKGWQQIAAFLAQPVPVVQRWAKTGMPVQRQGRFVIANSADLNKWLALDSGEPLNVVTDQTDLSSELKRALHDAQKRRRSQSRSAA